MDAPEPKTRKESKGRQKPRGEHPYSQKHVRAVEALRAKQQQAQKKPPAATSSATPMPRATSKR